MWNYFLDTKYFSTSGSRHGVRAESRLELGARKWSRQLEDKWGTHLQLPWSQCLPAIGGYFPCSGPRRKTCSTSWALILSCWCSWCWRVVTWGRFTTVTYSPEQMIKQRQKLYLIRTAAARPRERELMKKLLWSWMMMMMMVMILGYHYFQLLWLSFLFYSNDGAVVQRFIKEIWEDLVSSATCFIGSDLKLK